MANSLLIFLASVTGLGLAKAAWHALRRGRRPLVEVQPRYRSYFRHLGLLEPEDFLKLSTVIVSGHPDRHVGRVTLGEGQQQVRAFLKREHHIPWTTRLSSLMAGFGFVSRSLREGRTLQALQREDIGCAEWLAAGEDGNGRAFLLIREVDGGVELRAFLQAENDAGRRVLAMRRLGAALARLHHAGFEHPDLYAKHILINPVDGAIHVLDWQRSLRRESLGWQGRARDLAALHATVADSLASPWERLVCLRAYLAEATLRRPELAARETVLRSLLQQILAMTRRKLLRRHIKEKRQLPIDSDSQDWICVEGDALCVTRGLALAWPGKDADWLSLDHQPKPPGPCVTRRWLPLPDGRKTLLVHRQGRRPASALWNWIRRKPIVSVEKRQAGLLFRLQRHAVVAPRVLAMGERVGASGQYESFLLTELIGDTVRLDTWMARTFQGQTPDGTRARWTLLREVGEVLHRLHEAGCYLGGVDVSECLAVQVGTSGLANIVLASAEGLRLRRRPRARYADQDLVAVCRALAAAGCGRSDLRRLTRVYERLAAGEPGSTVASQGHEFLPGSRPFPDTGTLARALARPQLEVTTSGHVAGTPDASLLPTTSLWQRLVRGCTRFRQRADWNRYVGPDRTAQIMDVAVTDRFHAKQGRSTGRWTLEAAGDTQPKLTVYLKRHYQLPWWQGLLATLWPSGNWSPAMQEWEHLEWARRQGVPVPPVVAAGEFVGPWGRLQSFLAVEELTDMLPLNEAIPLASARLDPETFRRWKRGLVAEMARLTRMLHDRRCFHKDLYLCHFYIPRTDTGVLPHWRGRVHMIDLHRLGHHRWTWRMWQLKDLAQLLYSSEIPAVDSRDQLAFWAEYRGTGPRRGSDRWLRWWVLLKWRRYRRHNARHKAKAA